MRDLKRAVLAALLLAFVAGLGAGAWVSDLRAAGEATPPSMDRRVQAWTDRYGLSPSQERRLRDVLLRYDAGRTKILSELDTQRWQRIEKLRLEAREDIDRILQEADPAAADSGG